MVSLQKIGNTHLEQICCDLVEVVSHRDVSALLGDSQIEENGGGPRWERMLMALSTRQDQDKCSNNVIAFLSRALHPARFLDRHEVYAETRRKINFHLSFYGIAIGEDGKPGQVQKAETLSEAEARASGLRLELRRRSVHVDVIKFCRAELLQQNYFHCVLEASKSLAQKIRDKTVLTSDGAALVDEAFSIKNPRLAVNTLATDTERSEQTGFANFLKGIFGTFRNVTAHGPKIHWAVNKQEAMDALTIISYAHRRLDRAIAVPKS
jgi:uncharacterized protein (TIGR02391 family)